MGDKMRTLGDMLILVRVFPLPSVGIIYIYILWDIDGTIIYIYTYTWGYDIH